ncbi:MAG: NADH-quinone oxidoreductase subunit M [Actinomycetota bacterium]|nr:NADH-quinone oxidoreductase subunit M [Actinomycetota bacterium]
MSGFDHWVLSGAVFLPIVGAILIAFIPRANEVQMKAVALATTLVTLGFGVYLVAAFDYDRSRVLQFSVNRPWIDVIHSRYHVGVDGIALPLLVLSMFITVLCVIYSWDHFPEPRDPKGFLILMLILEVGMNGTFAAEDLILFFVFFELVLLPMYFMIGRWGGEGRQYASIKFFLFTLFGSALMILSFLALYFKAGGTTFDLPGLIAYFSDPQHALAHTTALVIFGGLFIGFAIKVPMFPFHTWLPDAHTAAPTVGSVILAAILLKLGTYGFIRIAIPMLPDAAASWAPWIGGLAVIGIIYGALCCLAQTDLKRLIAFSSVAHMGFVMLGIATLTSYGINAAVFGMVAHGLITGMLFFLAGSIGERYGTREIRRLGGLLVQAPRLGWILGFCAMASLGLPGLAGFWGEFPSILSSFAPSSALAHHLGLFRAYMVIAAVGTVLAAGYLLWMFQRVAFGVPKPEFEKAHIHDVHRPEWIAWTPLLLLIVFLGIYPHALFKTTDGAVNQATANVPAPVSITSGPTAAAPAPAP